MAVESLAQACLSRSSACMQEQAKQKCQSGASANAEASARPAAAAKRSSSILFTGGIVLVMAAILAVPFLSQASSSDAVT